jgi:hypothetical protein
MEMLCVLCEEEIEFLNISMNFRLQRVKYKSARTWINKTCLSLQRGWQIFLCIRFEVLKAYEDRVQDKRSKVSGNVGKHYTAQHHIPGDRNLQIFFSSKFQGLDSHYHITCVSYSPCSNRRRSTNSS